MLHTFETVVDGFIRGMYLNSARTNGAAIEYLKMSVSMLFFSRMHLANMLESEYSKQVVGVSSEKSKEFLRNAVLYIALGIEEEVETVIHTAWLMVALSGVEKDKLVRLSDTEALSNQLRIKLAAELDRVRQAMQLLERRLVNELDIQELSNSEKNCHLEPSKELLDMLEESSLKILQGSRSNTGKRGFLPRPFTIALELINRDLGKSVSIQFGKRRVTPWKKFGGSLTNEKTTCESVVAAVTESKTRCNSDCVQNFLNWKTELINNQRSKPILVECVVRRLQNLLTVRDAQRGH